MLLKYYFVPFLFVLLLFCSCSTTKYVPEKHYLLDKVAIKADNKNISTSGMEEYLQQNSNKNFLFFNKTRLKIYSLSGKDTTRWRNRFIRKMGEAPVLYSSHLTEETEKQLVHRMQNLGYLNAQVAADVVLENKKAEVTYRIQANDPYMIRNYEVNITDTAVLSILASPRVKRFSNLRSGIPFVPETLDKELQMLISAMRNQGYYNLTKENFYFLVDSALKSNQVDVRLTIRDSWENQEDSMRYASAFKRYRINSVTILSGYDRFDPESRLDFAHPDTVVYHNLKVIYGSRRFIQAPILFYNCFIRSGRYYSDRLLENTYSSLGSLSAVKQANIYFRDVSRNDTSLLNTFITVAPSNIFYWQTGLDGTNSAGDIGVAGYVTFQDRNIFNGSETFRIRLNGGIESITSQNKDLLSDNYYQYGIDFAFTFPRFLVPFIPKSFREQTNSKTVFMTGINWQNRPEYNQRFLNLDWMYKWTALRNRLNHTLDLYNINYIVTPWMSGAFRSYLDKPGNAVLKENYRDQLVTRSGYSVVYTSLPPSRAQNEGYTLRAGLDVAGTLPFIISKISGEKKEDGVYRLQGIPFAQYVKTGMDFTRFFMLNPKNIVVAHAGLGIIYPYGNSFVAPYEQRYFAGGPNSVRGWSSRTLGPGAYRAGGGDNDFINRNGDIKILLNLEYRLKTKTFLEYAVFVDAGNIWTIHDYENQQGGTFRWDSFWKQMALAWGIGIRPNFGFVLIRIDAGMKIYSPESIDNTQWLITKPNFKRDFAYHFAIGYPF